MYVDNNYCEQASFLVCSMAWIFAIYYILAASRLAPAEGRRLLRDRHHLPRTRIENI